MKFTFLIILLMAWLSITGHAQPSSINEVKSSFAKGNIGIINEYLDQSISITLNGQRGTYNHDQASNILKNFFNQTKPTEFSILKFGYSGENNAFIIGSLNTKEEDYRIYLFMKSKNKDKNFMIEGVKIDKE